VVPAKHGRMGFDEPMMATYNDTSAENAATDSARQVGIALKNLNMFKEFIESH
jgi:hypothetical protein